MRHRGQPARQTVRVRFRNDLACPAGLELAVANAIERVEYDHLMKVDEAFERLHEIARDLGVDANDLIAALAN